MIIMGIDPGSRKAGYGLVKIEGRKFRYMASGILRYDNVNEFLDRLGHIYDSCKQLIDYYQPTEIAFESLIYVKSVTSLARLAQARGAMVAAFMNTHKSRVFEYSPNLVKSTVTGYGHANKESVEKALGIIFGQQLNFKTNDESDALAVAICHALNRGCQINSGSNRSRSLKQVFKNYKEER